MPILQFATEMQHSKTSIITVKLKIKKVKCKLLILPISLRSNNSECSSMVLSATFNPAFCFAHEHHQNTNSYKTAHICSQPRESHKPVVHYQPIKRRWGVEITGEQSQTFKCKQAFSSCDFINTSLLSHSCAALPMDTNLLSGKSMLPGAGLALPCTV